MAVCTFCGKAQSEVGTLIPGAHLAARICNECVEMFHNRFEADSPSRNRYHWNSVAMFSMPSLSGSSRCSRESWF
jgi:ATP-dependent protease Clp ATPase subunit